ncbi:hypothetical protein [Pseudomonas sp. NBRC 111130]|uniref:hypothetical protein n=1 Tax=Pseudomonas sp. NBRC 111130 TaxID=1661045 RepID=UPI0006D461EC|nr:hypothetical protein [Pseudomonas sp. NBRC 111130]
MVDLYLDDVRGYWRDLAVPSFDEFWSEFQADRRIDSGSMLVIYRRLISCAFFLNHLADKAALMHGMDRGNHLISKIREKDIQSALQLDACRHFVNDAKHEMTRLQEASLRARNSDFDLEGESMLIQFHMLSTDGNTLFDMCDVICSVWRFWISYFDGTAKISFKDALAYRAGQMSSSPGSC